MFTPVCFTVLGIFLFLCFWALPRALHFWCTTGKAQVFAQHAGKLEDKQTYFGFPLAPFDQVHFIRLGWKTILAWNLSDIFGQSHGS